MSLLMPNRLPILHTYIPTVLAIHPFNYSAFRPTIHVPVRVLFHPFVHPHASVYLQTSFLRIRLPAT